ncbi:MAG: hypothetical protein HQL72_03730 [Magnetococcales bacterium]|nr:hypothetical protein [Magnetococcales bacterium]
MGEKDTDNVVDFNGHLIKKIGRDLAEHLKNEHPDVTAQDLLDVEWKDDDFDDED